MTRKDAINRTLAAVLFSAVGTGVALAADLPPSAAPPPRAPAVYAPPPPVYNWTGFYLGINGGWGFGKSDWNLSTLPFDTGSFNVSGGLQNSSFTATNFSGAPVPVTAKFNANLIRAGVDYKF